MQELLNLDLATLSEMKVYTASREPTSIADAPSIITVITAEEIRRHGYRNLRDALERVPGFLTYADNFTHMFGHRGFIENAMSNYLVMIDGHKLNNQLFTIGNQEHLFPRLSDVKRIEVVRSPSSTLWGSDASAGIIHIITYNGEDLDQDGDGAWQITADWEFQNNRRMANALYGADLGDESDLMLSLNFSESEGDWLPAYHADNDGYVLWPEARPWDPRWNLSGIYGPSHEIYLKYRIGDFAFIARDSEINPSRFQLADKATNSFVEWTRIHRSADLRYAPQLSDTIKLETSLYYDHHKGVPLDIVPGLNVPYDSYDTYNGYGASAIATHTLLTNRIKAGIAYDYLDFTSATALWEQYTGPRTEHIWGVFLEENYLGIDDWIFTAGIRYDHHSLRSKGGDVSPRAAVIHQIDDHWSMKYTYNTGHVRSSIRKYRTFTDEDTFINIRDGAPWIGVEHPQSTQSHDLQLTYLDDRLSMELTLFQTTIEEYATYIGYTYYNTPAEQAATGWYGYEYIDQNVGDLTSHGIELEGSYDFSRNFRSYGNVSYTKTKLSNRYVLMRGDLHSVDLVAEPDMDLVNYDLEKTGWPEYIWNLGVDFEPFAGHLFNVHYRGWSNNPIKSERQPNEFDEFGPEHFVDINYVTTALGRQFEFSAYIKNLFDNEAEYPAANDGGYTVNIGRTFGISGKLFF
ncbi:MAG: TonB-dependent receptor [Candidatus Thiodiazotropha sp.]